MPRKKSSHRKKFLALTKPFKLSDPKVLVLLGLAVVSGIVLVAFSTAASATPEIKGLAGKCLDDYQGRIVNGNKVELFTCNGTFAQHWAMNATDHTIRLGGKCLDVYQARTANGTKVELYTCNGGKNQKWTLNSVHELVSAQSGKCLDVPGFNTANGTQLDIWSCNGGSNQRWYPSQFVVSPSPSPSTNPTPTPSASATPTPLPTTTPKPSPTPTRTPTPTPTPVVGSSCTNPSHVLATNPSNPQDGITLSGYYVDTDTWNFAPYPGSQQTMYVCDYNNWYAMVNVNDNKNDGAVKTYPNVHKDFSSPAISSFHGITSSYAHTAPSYGAWDYAYDIWINNYNVELMIWTQSAGRQAHVPGVPVVATVTLSGITYDIHKSGSYIAYDMKTTKTSGTLNLLEIMNDMKARGYISTSATLSSIQYGVEVCDTSAINTKFEVNNFSVNTN